MKPLHAAAAAAVLATFAAGAVYSQQKPAPTQLGFLDIQKAFETYRKCSELAEQFKARNDAVLAELKAISKRAEELVGRQGQLNADSDEYAALDEQIAALKNEIDVKKKYRFHAIDVERLKRRTSIYKEICQEAQNYGAEKGLAAVLLYIPPDADFGDDLEFYMRTRAVLCRDDGLDVTKDVVSRLNSLLPPAAVKPIPPK